LRIVVDFRSVTPLLPSDDVPCADRNVKAAETVHTDADFQMTTLVHLVHPAGAQRADVDWRLIEIVGLRGTVHLSNASDGLTGDQSMD
jgi:hypothetical protein